MIYFARRVSIAMGHRLHNPQLSDEDNRKLYGKCNNPNGHGHQYTIEATLAGHVDPVTGFSASLPDLDRVLQEQIINRFDHKDFDRDFPEYNEVISSGENLTRVFWDLIRPHVPLVRVRVEETEKNAFEFCGDPPPIEKAAICQR